MEIYLQLSPYNHWPSALLTMLLACFVKVCRSNFLKLDLLSSSRICSTRMLPRCSPVSSASGIVIGVSISRLLTDLCGSRPTASCVPPPPQQPPLICIFYYCYFVSVLWYLFFGVGFRLAVPVEIDLVVESFVYGFPSSVTVLLQLMVVFVQQQPSSGVFTG